MAIETFSEKRTRVGSFLKALITPSLVYYANVDFEACKAVRRVPYGDQSPHPSDTMFGEDGFPIYVEDPRHPYHNEWETLIDIGR